MARNLSTVRPSLPRRTIAMIADCYRVTECEGFAILDNSRGPGSNANVGLSVQVVDTAYCGRVVESWRTETQRGKRKGSGPMRHDDRRTLIRALAAARAFSLNAGARL